MPDIENPKLYTGTDIEPPKEVAACEHAYAELDVTTNFSFLHGASHPDELVFTAALLGYRALAVTDINTLAGAVRMFQSARKVKGFRLIVGTRLVFADGTPDLLVWPSDKAAYARLSSLLTLGRQRGKKGECPLYLPDFLDHSAGLIAALVWNRSYGVAAAGESNLPLPVLGERAGERGGLAAGHGISMSLREQRPLSLNPSPRVQGEGGQTSLIDSSTRAIQLRRFDPDDRSIFSVAHFLREALGDRLSLAIHLCYGGDDHGRLDAARIFSRQTRIPLLATNHVHYHDPGRRPLQDVLTCIRQGCVIHEAGFKLFPNAERYLKAPEQMIRLFDHHPQAIERGLEIAARCTFQLNELRYDYPCEVVPPGQSPSDYLRALTYAGAAERYPQGISEKVRASLERELKFICHSKYESYFLTVHDLVRHAKSQHILCQGRGSAANSAVCYCLGVTAVDPEHFQLVFERFASEQRTERNEPPDIDIDFEHERREEVIQYVYRKYGRDRAAMTASLITYRGRSAVRDVGKVLGFSADTLDELAGKLDWWDRGSLTNSQLRECGIDPGDPSIRNLIELTTELLGFPRHLSQHVGGMVISQTPLHEVVPIENASMEDRTVIQWDKDDLDVLQIFKVDLLALGMLTCISKSLKLIDTYSGQPPMEMYQVPWDVRGVYEMISDADTIGVFQVESRAQMSMLPRLKPSKFYDLVIEVAIVRPGPIQGDMVHPYLKRREGLEAVEYPKDELREVLEKTLGVPLFQEQAMRMAMVAAKFTGAEADQLRRAMAAWKRSGGMKPFHDKFVNGMINNGYEMQFAERCFKQICGFGEYGFPESHAASFAKLVYVSAWLKRFHPAAFAAGLVNSQPMGFYAPAQIIRDAREHGVEVRPIDVNASEWNCTLEMGSETQTPGLRYAEDPDDSREESGSSAYLRPGVCPEQNVMRALPARDESFAPSDPIGHKSTWGKTGPAIRLGFRQIKGMREEEAYRIVAARQRLGAFRSVAEIQHAAELNVAAMTRLAKADALSSIGLTRRLGAWQALGLSKTPAPLFDEVHVPHDLPPLQPMPLQEEVITDYNTTGLSLKRHPVSFARAALSRMNVTPAAMIQDANRFPDGKPVKVAGVVLVRQRPGTASGVVFITLEDETGVANLIIWSSIFERYRRDTRYATLLQANGLIQREGKVIHVLAKQMIDQTHLLNGLSQASRDFH